jgi:8-oxo-dGTP pyrophosphatase MutT (NUDIX family)
MKLIDVVAWICVRDARLLVTRTRGRDAYYLPGGKRELGESDWQALARETREELDIELVAETLSLVSVVEAPAHAAPTGTRVRMICYQAEPAAAAPSLSARGEVEEIAWLDMRDRDRCAPAVQAVLTELSARGLIS